MTRAFAWAWIALCVALCGACDSSSSAPPLTREQMLDPENCKDCHPKHYEEWSSSMHAYAGRDPVFLAMNKRGQEQANLREFCVNCHAPMAVRENKIDNFADLSDVPQHLMGVTCYVCHNAIGYKEPHNNANITLADDTIMRGALNRPLKPTAHDVAPEKSRFHDADQMDSSMLCGTCHDIVVPNGTHIERTLAEYLESVNAKPGDGFNSCNDCHMKRKRIQEPAAPGYPGVAARDVHSHLWPAVDVALTPDMPNQDALRSAIESCELQAGTLGHFEVVFGNSLPGEPFAFTVQIEQLAGHKYPSGASADRRLWLELVAYDQAGQVVLQTGQIADGELEEKPAGDPKHDPQFQPFRDYWTDAQGKETHMFWEAAKFESLQLPAATQPNIPHYGERSFVTNRPMTRPPERIELWLRLRPMGVDVLQDLVKSGHLDPAVVDKMPTFTVTHQEATLVYEERRYKMKELSMPDCDTFECMLDPDLPFCNR
ncbi:MAG TPA: multiheme c-type cytochrome [Polyangiales bacterium]|nr:multiheme c-type cytochrome [Polyangiales bacterium]